MEKRSTTITGAIAILIATLLMMLGIPIGEGQMTDVIDTIVKLAAMITNIITPIIIWKDRLSKGDVKALGKRLKPKSK